MEEKVLQTEFGASPRPPHTNLHTPDKHTHTEGTEEIFLAFREGEEVGEATKNSV